LAASLVTSGVHTKVVEAVETVLNLLGLERGEEEAGADEGERDYLFI